MDWFYVEGSKSVGPVSEEKLIEEIQVGRVSGETFVWHEGMPEWKPCRDAGPKVPGSFSSVSSTSSQQACAQCGKAFAVEDLIKFEDSWVCATCKTIYLQKLKEGVQTTSRMIYGGFWLRFGAKFIDGILMQIVNYAVVLPLMFMTDFKSTEVFGIVWALQMFLSIAIAVAFNTFFLGKYGATPGKMACRLKVVNPDGTKITYLKAFSRYFGEILSSLTLTIGYLIAAWDDEKRALHDRVCNTRVIRIN